MSDKQEIARLQKENNNLSRDLMKMENNWKLLYAKHKELKTALRDIRIFVDKQTEDEGLWFKARYATEAYIQSGLRDLHLAIENQTTNKENK